MRKYAALAVIASALALATGAGGDPPAVKKGMEAALFPRGEEKWQDGPVTYLGIAVDGFPNMFMLTGPGSPNVLTNVVCAIEQHVEWTADCIERLEERGARRFEALEPYTHDWTDLNNELAKGTLYPEGNSW